MGTEEQLRDLADAVGSPLGAPLPAGRGDDEAQPPAPAH
jgi:hypothetical protein